MVDGKFQGVMAATTPMGCMSTKIRLSGAKGGMTSPLTRLPSSENHSINEAE
jgi:hypothetical protein